MTRIFVDVDLVGRDTVVVTGDTAHYLRGVLRSRRGNRFVAVDPSGRECEVLVEGFAGGEVRGRIVSISQAPAESALQLELYQALLKHGNFELVLQKGTELGVTRFVPTVTERTVPRPVEERVEGRGERWDRIVGEACRQCGRNLPPTVGPPLDWPQALAEFRTSGAVGVIPYEEMAGEGPDKLREALRAAERPRRLALFIGPEGGFSAQEVQQAREAGVVPVSMGPRILRAETAAIAACAIAISDLGDW